MPRGTLDTATFTQVSTTWLSHSVAGLPRPFVYLSLLLSLSTTPKILLPLVWPLPISLATTFGISVDYFSSPYLDVSVQAVPRVRLFDSTHAGRGSLCRVSPFGNPRFVAYLQLPEAYRSLSRPSSAPDAKAFPLRSFQLDQYKLVEKSIILVFLAISRIMQAHIKKFSLAEIDSLP